VIRVLGLTGPNAAGKGEVAAYLEQRGFAVHSLSDIVREAAREQGFPPEREHLIRIGTELRREGGAGVLARRMLSRLGQRDVVDSIRHPAEVAVLREVEGFLLVAVDAPMETRFRRGLARARAGDPTTLEQFEIREAQENTTDPAAQQLRKTFALSDRVLSNEGDLSGLHAEIDRLLTEQA